MTAARTSVMVTCGGKWVGRVLQLRRAMQEVPALAGGKFLIADRAELTPAGCFADEAVVVPAIADHDYVERLLEICAERRVRIVVPLIDLDLERLSPHLDAFRAAGTSVISPPRELVELCFDKVNFADFANSHGLPVPRSYPAASVPDEAFPVFTKRRRGFGSVGAAACRTRGELLAAVARFPDLVVQQLVEATEVSVDAYITLDGRCIVRVPRVRDQVSGGEAQQSHTIRTPEALALADRTIEALTSRGVRGPLNIQLFMSEPAVLIEVNTRLGAGSVLANQAVDGRFYRAMLADAIGEPVSGDRDEYREGMWMYRYFGEVFHDGTRPLTIIPGRDPT